MNPIFSYVDPVMLFKKIPPYEYLFFVLYKGNNEDFKERFRQNMRKYHKESGKNIGLFVFDFPSDRWVKDNFEYFLKRYRCASTHGDWRIILDEVSKSASRRTQGLREWLKDTEYYTLEHMDNFMKLLNIEDNNLPALVIFIKNQPAEYYLKSNISIMHIENLLDSLTSPDNYRFNDNDLHRFPENIVLHQIVENINDGFSSKYWEIAQAIKCLQLQKDNGREPIERLIGKFPEFKELKYPDRFEWHKDLIKWLRKYNHLVERFVVSLNILIDTPENRGLCLEKIGNFWRFRISDKYRSHYFERDGKKVCYFLGYHDYQLRSINCSRRT